MKSKDKQKFFIALAVFMLVPIICVLVILYYGNAIITSNWQTYIDKSDNFSIKYPPRWTQNKAGFSSPHDEPVQVVKMSLSHDPSGLYGGVTMQSQQTAMIDDYDSKTVGNTKAITYTQKTKGQKDHYVVLIGVHPDTTLILSTETTNKKVLNTMLTTFETE